MAYNPIVIGGGTEADAQRVTIASDSTGVLSVDDNGGALTVDGTVTANLAAGTNNIGDVDVLSSALPTGASTSANQTTIIGHLDGVEGLLTTIDADTSNLATIETNTDFGTVVGGGTQATALRVTIASDSTGLLSVDDNGSTLSVDDGGGVLTVDGTVAISGTVTVDLGANNDVTVTSGTVTANLAAGTNNIGDVDVLSIVPGTGATNLGKAIDTATGATDTGVLALATRDDDLGTLTPADADNAQLRVDSEGALWVTLKPNSTEGASTMNASSSDGATALTSTAQAIKASAGTLKGYYIYNPNSSAQFVQFYNTAQGSVTVGTTSPLFMLTIPATSGANLWMPDGIQFSTAMSWAATSTAGGNGAPTTALDAVAWYK